MQAHIRPLPASQKLNPPRCESQSRQDGEAASSSANVMWGGMMGFNFDCPENRMDISGLAERVSVVRITQAVSRCFRNQRYSIKHK